MNAKPLCTPLFFYDIAFRFANSAHQPEDRKNALSESGSCRMSSHSFPEGDGSGIERKCTVLIFWLFCIKAKEHKGELVVF